MIPEIIIGSEFPEKVIPLIKNARTSIKIIVFDWRLYADQPAHSVSRFVLALKDACERNVNIQVLLSNDAVRKQLSAFGFQCKSLYSSKLIHAKILLIDETLAIIGSHNYTQNAFENNLEVSVCVDLQTRENELNKFFDRVWPL